MALSRHAYLVARCPLSGAELRRSKGRARGTSRPTLVSSSRAHSTPKVRTMKTLVAVAILAMVLVPPALAKAKRAQSTRAQSAPQQGYQSSERAGYYHGYRLSEWYRDSLSSY